MSPLPLPLQVSHVAGDVRGEYRWEMCPRGPENWPEVTHTHTHTHTVSVCGELTTGQGSTGTIPLTSKPHENPPESPSG